MQKGLLSFLKRYIWQYIGGLACLLAVDFLELYIPQFTGEVTDGLTAGTMTGKLLLLDVALIILVASAVAALRFGWRVLMFGASRRVEQDLREELYAQMTTLSTPFFQTHKTGDLMARFINDLQAGTEKNGIRILPTDPEELISICLVTPLAPSPAARRFLDFAQAHLGELT